MLLFWAPQVLPSAEVRSELESLARPYQGKVFIGLVDVSRDAALAQHLRVQGLPSMRVVHEGQIVHQLDGPSRRRRCAPCSRSSPCRPPIGCARTSPR
jgi:thioredoxin-like negative regulator of GroEL